MLQKSSTLPAITKNADPSAYHSLGTNGDGPRVMSRSSLHRFAECPSKWKLGTKDKETSSTEWGTLLDTVVLTPGAVESTYAICPEEYQAEGKKKGDPSEMKPWNWNATVCKEWRKEAEGRGMRVVKPDAISDAWKAKSRLMECDKIKPVLESSDTQVMVCVEWNDRDTGIVVPIKCLIDLVPSKESDWFLTLADLKSTADGSARSWTRSVFQYWYYVQAALYLDAYNIATAEKRNRFLHAIQESEEPFEPVARTLSDTFIRLGRETYEVALQQYCKCVQSDIWPGLDYMANPREKINGILCVEPEPWMILG